MPKLRLYKLDDTIDEFEIDEAESYGITALGYMIKIKGEKRRLLVHPERYKYIEIIEGN